MIKALKRKLIFIIGSFKYLEE